MTIDWTQPEGKRIVSATLTKDGSTLDPAKTYTVATNNYIITNTTDFPTFANAIKHTEWGTCESALRALIGQNGWESKMARARRHHQLRLRSRGPHAHTGPDA